ncbi:MAG: S-layer homology domain-containing protein [Clostridia bacterium]|nr:S-layer homology domain-containing protein [Clostridia bacterium]NCC68525.1 S-layer homology domain-containing protein [Clostridia bacterium]
MFKKIFSILLILVLAFSISIPAFAAGFSDLNEHWSKEYMEDLADQGYLSGYEDGTMRPDNNITACETLALLSRFYDPGDEGKALIAADFGDFVAQTVPAALSWAYDEIEICLAAGIITEDELKETDLMEPVVKEQLALFLVRAMQLQDEAEALSGTELTFDDSEDISENCIGSVAELVSLGIVLGNEKHDFSPKLGVVRGIAAAMVSRSLNYIRKAGTALVIEDYDGATRTEGIITAAASSSLTVCGMDGLTRIFSVSSASSVMVNGTARTLTSAYLGCYVTVTAKDGAVNTAAIESESAAEWVQGTVYSVFNSTSVKYLYVTDQESGDTSKYTIASTAVITLDGQTAAFSSIVNGSFVTLKLEDGAVAEVSAAASDYEIDGTISSIEYGTVITLKVEDEDSTVYCFHLDISDLPAIYRGTTAVTVDRLSVGDDITVAVKNCVVSSIVTEGSENTVTGELVSMTTTTSGTQWVVKAEDGSSGTYTIDTNVGVYSGSSSILISDIQAGDTVTLVVYGSAATEIYLVTSANSTTKVSGTVLAVDTTARTITILTSKSKLVYIDLSSVKSIITASTGQSLSIYSISADSELVAYGTYKSSTNFVATSIIIES